MDTGSESQLRSAFVLLQDVVRDFQVRGRTANAAGLKPALQQKTYGMFAEHRLNFKSFREFLLAAERNGFVRIRPASGGDLEVLGPEAELSAAAISRQVDSRPAPERPGRVRPDLWRAFNDWTPGWKRLYKVTTGAVYMYPEYPGVLGDERPEYAAYRAEAAATPQAFKQIQPIPQATQRAWMAGFTQAVTDLRMRGLLEAALDGDRPFGLFTRVVFGTPNLGPAWNRFRTEKVLDEILRWAAENGLEVQPFAAAVAEPQPPRAAGIITPSPVTVDGPQTDEAIRQRILQAVERMPLAELLRLAIPLEYVIER